jgi:ATP-dependent Clp protease ATP-binding subunit ClpA
MQNNYIATEHLLLALARDVNALPARMLTSVGITLAALQEELGSAQEIAESTSAAKRPGGAEPPPSDSQSKRYTQIVDTAHNIAAQHRRPELTPVHMAIALFSAETGMAARVIDGLGVDRSMVRKLLDQAEYGIGETTEDPPAMSPEATYVVDQACSIWKELLGCRRVGTEHLLVALFDDVKLTSLLVAAGLEPKAVVAAIRRLYDEEG